MSNEITPNQGPSAISPMEAVNATKSLEMYDRMDNPLEAVKALGASIFKSGMFGCTKQEQGEVLAMQCLAERKPPLEIASTYHFINGKLAIKSEALLGRFIAAGGVIQWLERSDTKVVATFSKGGSTVTVTTTIEQFRANGVATGANKGTWDKYPRQMLSARAITEGVKLVGADCCMGVVIADDMGPRTVNLNLDDVIPPGKEAEAKALFIQMGFMTADQEISDIHPANIRALRKQADSIHSFLTMEGKPGIIEKNF